MKQFDFQPEKYPILMEALNPETLEVVWSLKVEKPEGDSVALVPIPPLAKKLGYRVEIRITYADGQVEEMK